jgi:ATP-dependent Lhr-like helicase
MEARGTIRGGRFVTGFSGEQYAHPDAIDVLRAVRKQPRNGQIVRISAADPLNLAGIVLPGPRVPAISANTVSYLDGAADDGAADDGAADEAAGSAATA